MQVYVVSEGEYSNVAVVAVFSTLQAAKAFVDSGRSKRDGSNYCPFNEPEVFELDKTPSVNWRVRITEQGDIDSTLAETGESTRSLAGTYGKGANRIWFAEDRTEDEAIETARNARAKALAEQK